MQGRERSGRAAPVSACVYPPSVGLYAYALVARGQSGRAFGRNVLGGGGPPEGRMHAAPARSSSPLRIERVAEVGAKEIEAEHRDHAREPGEDGDVYDTGLADSPAQVPACRRGSLAFDVRPFLTRPVRRHRQAVE